MEHPVRAHSPSHAIAREAFEQVDADVIEALGRLSARRATIYRTEQPRTWELVAKYEEFLAMVLGVVDFIEA